MFKGYSVALPFTYNKEDGPYALNKSMMDVVKQNLKTLVLTDRGERIMIPDFGVGLKKFLFENFSQTTEMQIKSEVSSQVRKYMPFVSIESINVLEDTTNLNNLIVQINFSVPALNTRDTLVLGV